jgi:hypothetical protein
MRAYFLHAVFPAYVEIALEQPAGWVLGVPCLRALCHVLHDLKLNIDSTNPACTASVKSMLATILDSMRRAASVSMATNDAFSVPHIIGTLTLLLRAFVHVIKLLDWLCGDDQDLDEAVRDCAEFLIRFGAYARKMVTTARGCGEQEEEAQRPLDVRAMSDRPPSPFELGRKHCKDTLKTYLLARWSRVGEGWAVLDGAAGRVVSLPRYPGEDEEDGGGGGAKAAFEGAVEEVLRVAARTEVLGEAVREVDAGVWRREGRGWPYRGIAGLELVFC